MTLRDEITEAIRHEMDWLLAEAESDAEQRIFIIGEKPKELADKIAWLLLSDSQRERLKV